MDKRFLDGTRNQHCIFALSFFKKPVFLGVTNLFKNLPPHLFDGSNRCVYSLIQIAAIVPKVVSRIRVSTSFLEKMLLFELFYSLRSMGRVIL